MNTAQRILVVGAGAFSLIYLRDSEVIALDCVNAPRYFVQGRVLVVNGARLSRDMAANIAVSLKSLLLPQAQDV